MEALIILAVIAIGSVLIIGIMNHLDSRKESKVFKLDVEHLELPEFYNFCRVFKNGQWINFTHAFPDSLSYDEKIIEFKIYQTPSILKEIEYVLPFVKVNVVTRDYDNREIISDKIFEVEKIETLIYFNKESAVKVHYSKCYDNLENE